MFSHNFVPLEETEDGRLAIAIADPSKLMMIDEIGMLLRQRIVTKVATLAQITEILKKTEQSKRVLEDASEGFTLDVIRDDEGAADDSISIDPVTILPTASSAQASTNRESTPKRPKKQAPKAKSPPTLV